MHVQKVSNETRVPLVDQGGAALETRIFLNTPWALLDLGPVVIIDWTAQDGQRPKPGVVARSITVDGVSYHGGWGWGSAVKRGQTFGLTRDVGVETGMFEFVRDGCRLKRWLLAEGLYGLARIDGLRVKIVPPGTVAGGLLVEDGFGYIGKRLAADVSNDHEKIAATSSRESFQFWQRLPWDEVQAECLPLLEELAVDLSDPTRFAFNLNGAHQASKQRWIDWEPELELHRVVANSFSRGLTDFFRRCAGTVPTNASWRIAVPAAVDTVGVAEETVVYRYPIDSNSSIQVVRGDASARAEIERVAQMEVIQFSLSNLEFFASGCLGVVADDPSRDWDILICSENIKLAAYGVRNARKRSALVMDNACLVFTQHFEAGAALGFNAAFLKRMGGDFDGDLVTLFKVQQDDHAFDAVAAAIRAFPAGATTKLRKSNFLLSKADRRPEMVCNCMVNLVGLACNLDASTHMVRDRAALAERLGFADLDTLDEWLNFLIKAGTDGFKSFVLYRRMRDAAGTVKDVPLTLDTLMRRAGVLQSNVTRLFGMMAPETRWARSDWAFSREVPQIVSEDTDLEGWDQDQLRLAVHPSMDGTVQQIARIMLPNIRAAIIHPIESKPLTYFRKWARMVSSELYKEVFELQIIYNGWVKRLNFADPAAVKSFTARWAQRINEFIEHEGLSRETVGTALWVVSHSSRSSASGAASIFLGMPDQARRISREKPGLSRREETVIMTGVLYNVVSPPASWSGTVRIENHLITSHNKRIHRKVVFAPDLATKPKEHTTQWPKGMAGVISLESDQPDPGTYAATWNRLGDAKAWQLTIHH